MSSALSKSILFRSTQIRPLHPTILPFIRQFHSNLNPIQTQTQNPSQSESNHDLHSSFHQTKTHSSTISPDEIQHFNSLASTWWDENGGFGLLHRMNPIRTEFLRQRILYDTSPQSSMIIEKSPSHQLNPNRFLTGQKVLDVGCGGGIFSEVLSRLGGDVLGIDAAADSIKVASDHASKDSKLNFHPHHSSLDSTLSNQENRLTYRHASVEELLNEDHQIGLYDVVCAMEVIEHVEDPFVFLSALSKLTKPGGHLILSTISRTPLAKLLTIDLAESNLPFIGLVPPGTHTYEKFMKPKELTEFFRNRLGWATSLERYDLEIRGSFYEPFRSQWNLFPREFPLGELVNYFFGIKKPHF